MVLTDESVFWFFLFMVYFSMHYFASQWEMSGLLISLFYQVICFFSQCIPTLVGGKVPSFDNIGLFGLLVYLTMNSHTG